MARGEFSSSLPSKYFGGEEYWKRGIFKERNFYLLGNFGEEEFQRRGILERRNFEERNFGEEEEFWRRGILEERNFSVTEKWHIYQGKKVRTW